VIYEGECSISRAFRRQYKGVGQESGLRLVVITLYLNPDQYLFFSSELLNSLPYFAHVHFLNPIIHNPSVLLQNVSLARFLTVLGEARTRDLGISIIFASVV
jgi:hypothetical protein